MLAPVVIFAYRRPNHLRNLLTSLMRCEGFDRTPVIVYCDGARNEDETELVMATRDVAKTMLGDRATYHFGDTHLGLSHSVIMGVSQTVERFGRAIVLEDDLEVNPGFLSFMNEALDRYAHDKNVFQISGYMVEVPELSHTAHALFLPFTVSWGWATWKRAWDQFDPQASGWEALHTDKNLRRKFNLDGTYDYATMLIRQMQGLRDSWAIRWYWTVFKCNGLILFPPVSLVTNAGFDGSGTHGRGLLRRLSKNEKSIVAARIALPESIYQDSEWFPRIKNALWKQNGGWIAAITNRIRFFLKY